SSSGSGEPSPLEIQRREADPAPSTHTSHVRFSRPCYPAFHPVNPSQDESPHPLPPSLEASAGKTNTGARGIKRLRQTKTPETSCKGQVESSQALRQRSDPISCLLQGTAGDSEEQSTTNLVTKVTSFPQEIS